MVKLMNVRHVNFQSCKMILTHVMKLKTR